MNEIFRELGVDYIIEGGQTMNPSTEDMLTAIDGVNAEPVSYTHLFANSCNASFANIGLSLDKASYRDTAEDLLFNKALPSVLDYSKSSFAVTKDTDSAEMMMTAMGQGKTLTSPCLLYTSGKTSLYSK